MKKGSYCKFLVKEYRDSAYDGMGFPKINEYRTFSTVYALISMENGLVFFARNLEENLSKGRVSVIRDFLEKSYELGIEELLPVAKVFGSLEKIVRENGLVFAQGWLEMEQNQINAMMSREEMIKFIDESFRLQTPEELYTKYKLSTMF